jgi:hypothetical protein
MAEYNEFAVASELGISIRSPNDISNVLLASLENGGLILTESELCPEFFDLRTGLAGEALQKFANYRARVAFVVKQHDSHGERFSELMREHSRHPLVRFFGSDGDAKAWLRNPAS